MFISSAMMVVLTLGSPYSLKSRSASSRIRSRVRRGGLRSMSIVGAMAAAHSSLVSRSGKGWATEIASLLVPFSPAARIPQAPKTNCPERLRVQGSCRCQLVQVADAVLAVLGVLAVFAFFAGAFFAAVPERRDTC